MRSGSSRIGVGPCREQVLRALDAALARGIQEGGETAAVHVLGTRLGDDLALPLADGAAGVEVGALRRQELDHLALALRRGPHQRRLLAEGLAGVDVGTGLDEQPGGFDLAAAGRRHQRRFTFGVGEIGVGARLEQHVDDRCRAENRGFGDGRGPEVVLRLDVGAGFDQRAHQLDVVVGRGPHQRRGAVGAGCIRVGALGQHGQGRRAIAALDDVEQRAVGRGRNRDRGGPYRREDNDQRPPLDAHPTPQTGRRRCRRSSPPGCCSGRRW